MVSVKANKKNTSVILVSQNVRGLKSDARLEELFSYIIRMGIIGACLQETWRSGAETLKNGNCILLLAGQDPCIQLGKRGSQGVGIGLSPDGVEAWKAGGCELHNDLGARVIAIRLLLRDVANNDVGVFLVSAYAPVSSQADCVWEQYYNQLDRCIQRRQPNDILVIVEQTATPALASEQIELKMKMFIVTTVVL